MGITGLLPLLKSIQRATHIQEWQGKIVGIDAYGWLHKGAISCAYELALGKPTRRYVDYVMHRVKMLRHYGVEPYLVFDGDYLPSKAGTEAQRARSRSQAKAEGLQWAKVGLPKKAFPYFQKAIDITPTMARHVIDACAMIGVQCLVAPYEADSQLYYLEKMGIIDAVVSEDSDMLVFGVKTLITKIDQYGECTEVNRDKFSACTEVNLVGWSQTQFRHMCILSGCDYLESVPSVGLKTAYKYIRQYRDVDRAISSMRFEKTVPPGYAEAFKRADATFQYQRVFCPLKQDMVMANDPPPETTIDDEMLVYIGPEVDRETACAVARGDLDPITKRPIGRPTNQTTLSAFARPLTAPARQAPISQPSTVPARAAPAPRSLTTPARQEAVLHPSTAPGRAAPVSRPSRNLARQAPLPQPSITPSQLAPISRSTSTARPGAVFTPEPKNKTISSLFKSASEARPATARKPLQSKNLNAMAAFHTVPAKRSDPPSSTSAKRPLSKPTVPSSKKPRPSPSEESVPTTEEHSSFFKAQRRRPVSPTRATKHTSTSSPSMSKSPEMIPETPVHDRVHTWPPKETEHSPTQTISKVAQGWKEKYGFQGKGSGLGSILAKQKTGMVGTQGSSLQRLRSMVSARRT